MARISGAKFTGNTRLPTKSAESRLAGLSVLVASIGAEVRARRDAEHTYTAATVAATGAVAWGVAATAAVDDRSGIPWWRHPALAGALICLMCAGAVWLKICREHQLYYRLRLEQFRLATSLAEASGLEQIELPPGLRKGAIVGSGHLFSGAILAALSIAAVLFCLTVWAMR